MVGADESTERCFNFYTHFCSTSVTHGRMTATWQPKTAEKLAGPARTATNTRRASGTTTRGTCSAASASTRYVQLGSKVKNLKSQFQLEWLFSRVTHAFGPLVNSIGRYMSPKCSLSCATVGQSIPVIRKLKLMGLGD